MFAGMKLSFSTVASEEEVSQILDLQTLNLVSAISPVTASTQGFLTVQHNTDVLLRMNKASPSIIARDGNLLAGYALVMLPEFADDIPVLKPLFDLLPKLPLEAFSFSNPSRWFVMGQICVAEAYRGKGVFDGLYRKMREEYGDIFDFTVTEVARRNARSLRAHQRVGFETIHCYEDSLTGEIWQVLVLQF